MSLTSGLPSGESFSGEQRSTPGDRVFSPFRELDVVEP